MPPALVQHVSTASTRVTQPGATFHLLLPNASLSQNCLLIAFMYAPALTVTSVTDNAGNTYTLLVGGTDTGGGPKFAIFGVFGATAGARHITIVLSGTTDMVVMHANEWSGIALSSAVDGTAFQALSSTAWQAGSFTTTQAGDLILQVGMQSESIGWYGTSMAAQSGFTLLSADLADGSAAQYTVQASAGAINPTITVNPNLHAGVMTLALKAAAAGTLPGPGIRVLRHQDYTVGSDVTTYQTQFPCSGNLLVAVHDGFNGTPNVHCRVSTITDNLGNTWVSRATASQNTNAAPGAAFFDHQILDAVNATTGNTERLTVTFDNQSGGSSLSLYDVVNALAAPFDNAQTQIGNQTSGSGPISTVAITPTTLNGLVIAMMNQDIGTTYDLSGMGSTAYFDTPWYPEESGGFNALAEDKGNAHVYNASLSPITFVWRNTVDSASGVGGWAAVASAYKGTATDTIAPGPPTRLRLVRP